MRKGKVVLILLTIVLLAACSTKSKAVDSISSNGESAEEKVPTSYNLAEGMDMPNVVVETNKGNTFDLSATEKPAFINFWATWCPPCRVEMPEIQNLYEEYLGKMDFVLVNVGETKEIIEDFLIENSSYTFPIGYDVEDKYAMAFNITAIPTTYIVGKDKKIKNFIIGARSGEQFKEYIEKALSE